MQFLAILRFWREAAIGALVIVAGLLWLNGKAESARAAKWQTRSIETQAALDTERQAVRDKTALAKAQDAANAARVESNQKTVSLETLEKYRADIADLQRRYTNLRLHPGTAKTASGRSGGTAVPEVPNTPGGTNPASAPDSLACALNTVQLGRLIDWVTGQQSINRSATPPQ